MRYTIGNLGETLKTRWMLMPSGPIQIHHKWIEWTLTKRVGQRIIGSTRFWSVCWIERTQVAGLGSAVIITIFFLTVTIILLFKHKYLLRPKKKKHISISY